MWSKISVQSRQVESEKGQFSQQSLLPRLGSCVFGFVHLKQTWKQRRRVVAPGFHTIYLEGMVQMFANCSKRLISKLEKLLEAKISQGEHEIELDLEAEFSNLALDIIGVGVFNYLHLQEQSCSRLQNQKLGRRKLIGCTYCLL
ncbi:hypothetical protein L1887_34595 [Cichorium endivia]|nr:hypothetical protein L1887_34595 [Cichorium endivia]